MSRRQSLLVTATLGAALTFSLVAAAKLSKVDTSTASFHATGPAGLGIDGSTTETTVADDGTKVTITVPLANLSTGIGLRDKHMKEHIEADTFPNASLEVPRANLVFPKAGADTSADAKGTFKLHGKSKEVTFHYTAKLDGSNYAVTGTATINLTDYGIAVPSYLGVAVKPDINVKVSFKAKDN